MATFKLAPGAEPLRVDAGAEFVMLYQGQEIEVAVAYAERYVRAGKLVRADYPNLPSGAVGVYDHRTQQVVEAQDF